MELKSPSIPLFQRGKLTSPPFDKGRLGGILRGVAHSRIRLLWKEDSEDGPTSLLTFD